MNEDRAKQMQAGFEVTEIGAMKYLMASIVTTAVDDYRMCERKGFVRHGKLMAQELRNFKAGEDMRFTDAGERHYLVSGFRGVGRGLKTEVDVKELLVFLWRDMDELLEAACLDVSADAIRAQLNFPKERPE